MDLKILLDLLRKFFTVDENEDGTGGTDGLSVVACKHGDRDSLESDFLIVLKNDLADQLQHGVAGVQGHFHDREMVVG
jgi:hypothetical protein